MGAMIDRDIKNKILHSQKMEITEHFVYKNLAAIAKKEKHAEIFKKIAEDELKHYEFFKTLTNEELGPDRFKVFWYTTISRTLGLNFGLKLMEGGEGSAQGVYKSLKPAYPNIEKIISDEEKHERALLDMIDEERLMYMSSVVLGLNDALVELTASLAGFTLALQDSRLIGVVGAITGIAASTSMAASEYLATKHEQTDKDPIKASLYTGVAYVGTVILLVAPYFFLKNIFVCLGLAILNALFLILIFTFYISVAKDLSFKKRFLEMAGLSLTIAVITFFIGLAIRKFFGVSA
ncbi:MAG: VIT1/CCC1 transporter family protein [Candidatus Omnitrophica bacterium]|nr:VIT1/CCC1 transporter family protein [Candidatus Omnitrophota bacterium]